MRGRRDVGVGNLYREGQLVKQDDSILVHMFSIIIEPNFP